MYRGTVVKLKQININPTNSRKWTNIRNCDYKIINESFKYLILSVEIPSKGENDER